MLLLESSSSFCCIIIFHLPHFIGRESRPVEGGYISAVKILYCIFTCKINEYACIKMLFCCSSKFILCDLVGFIF